MFDNFDNNLEQAKDSLGGGFQIHKSNIYPSIIKQAYIGKSEKGASFLHLEVEMEGGLQYREDIYFTNQKGENFYYAKDKNGNPTDKKAPLPGFSTVNDIALVVSGEGLGPGQVIEDKYVKVYNKEAKEAIPTSVPVLVEWIGKEVALAIQHTLENKTEKNDATGRYEPIAEDIERNIIAKVFDPESKRTVSEALDGREAGFFDQWLDKNKDKVRDIRKYKDGSGPKSSKSGLKPSGPPQANNSESAPKRSLFGAKK